MLALFWGDGNPAVQFLGAGPPPPNNPPFLFSFLKGTAFLAERLSNSTPRPKPGPFSEVAPYEPSLVSLHMVTLQCCVFLRICIGPCFCDPIIFQSVSSLLSCCCFSQDPDFRRGPRRDRQSSKGFRNLSSTPVFVSPPLLSHTFSPGAAFPRGTVDAPRPPASAFH